jgi:hypothetical protein
MDYDILQSVSQGGDGAQDAENSRIAAIADELERLCAIYEAQCRVGQTDVTTKYSLTQLIASVDLQVLMGVPYSL